MDFETYSQTNRFQYAELAEIVASVMNAALKAYPAKFRLQQVQHRAKSIDSLKKSLVSLVEKLKCSISYAPTCSQRSVNESKEDILSASTIRNAGTRRSDI